TSFVWASVGCLPRNSPILLRPWGKFDVPQQREFALPPCLAVFPTRTGAAMRKIHTSRRAAGLKDSDYDHEISLVDRDASTLSSPLPSSPDTTQHLGGASTAAEPPSPPDVPPSPPGVPPSPLDVPPSP